MSQRDIERLQLKQLAAHAARTTTTTGTGVKVQGDVGHGALAIYDISAVGADADETLTPKIEGTNADDSVLDANATWEDAIAAGEAYTVATQGTGAQIGAVRVKPFRRYRHVDTIAGTTPSFTYGVHLIVLAAKAPTSLPALA